MVVWLGTKKRKNVLTLELFRGRREGLRIGDAPIGTAGSLVECWDWSWGEGQRGESGISARGTSPNRHTLYIDQGERSHSRGRLLAVLDVRNPPLFVEKVTSGGQPNQDTENVRDNDILTYNLDRIQTIHDN